MMSASTPFMRQVVEQYTTPGELPNLAEYCFVFPNRRSATFFKRYLTERLDEIDVPAFMPTFTTISDMIGRYSHGAEAGRNELLFALYDTYRRLLAEKNRLEQLPEFDRFRFWAEMILNDFNDVDLYMADAAELFKNVKDLKEIAADYLSPEQKEVVNRLWGDADYTSGDHQDVERFWIHTLNSSGKDDSVTYKFLKLWELLYPLYVEFRKRLRRQGLTYSGMAYREATEKLRSLDASDLPYRRYIFVGFNVLSTSETLIFDRLRDIGCADFYWDFSSPAFFNDYGALKGHPRLLASMINFHNRATLFVGKNILRYPSLHPFPFEVESRPRITVTAVPGNTAQTKETQAILSRWSENPEIIPHPEDAIDTCVVVNDENLFIPMLHSIPESISTVNITLGLPMRQTETATLMSAIISMQLRKRRLKGEINFYYEDVLAVVNHPLVLGVLPLESTGLQKLLQAHKMYNVECPRIAEEFPELGFIFSPVSDSGNSEEVFGYMKNLIDTLSEKIYQNIEAGTPVEGSNRHLAILEYYRKELTELHRLAGLYAIEMNQSSYFHMIEAFINSSTLNFIGKPLRGLQIMSLLETRTLDFRNLIMLSMNERIFPRKHFAKTFIPNSLRKGYGLSTIEHQESMFAYYFYRLLTRAERVELLYDSRTSGISSGEMSRYIYQLKYLRPYPDIKFRTIDFKSSSFESRVVEVKKNPVEMARFLEGGDKRLSASAIKSFAHCPLEFYFKYVQGWNADTDINEYMGAITYGNVVHNVLQNLYENVRGENDMVKITPEVLDAMKSMRHPVNRLNMIEFLVQKKINTLFHHLPKEKELMPLTGESKLLGSIMVKAIHRLLEQEKKFTPFYFWQAEYSKTFVWEIVPGLKVNFRMDIDRIDYIETSDSYRFIDYKTGKDETDVAGISTLLSSTKNYAAVFQLLTYAEGFCALNKRDYDIQPMIYRLQSIVTDGLNPVRYTKGKKKYILHCQKDVRDEFVPYLRSIVEEIFDEEKPFTQVKDTNKCSYCTFAGICGRIPKED